MWDIDFSIFLDHHTLCHIESFFKSTNKKAYIGTLTMLSAKAQYLFTAYFFTFLGHLVVVYKTF